MAKEISDPTRDVDSRDVEFLRELVKKLETAQANMELHEESETLRRLRWIADELENLIKGW